MAKDKLKDVIKKNIKNGEFLEFLKLYCIDEVSSIVMRDDIDDAKDTLNARKQLFRDVYIASDVESFDEFLDIIKNIN